MDVWLAKSDKPTPVLVSIHGGGFNAGNRSIGSMVLDDCLKSGISAVAITYRLVDEAKLPAAFLDSARAIQFIRSKAKEWNLDPTSLDNLPQEKYRLFEECSPITHLTKEDAPALLIYHSTMETPITSQGNAIHHPRFGKVLKEKIDALGIECQVHAGVQGNRAAMLVNAHAGLLKLPDGFHHTSVQSQLAPKIGQAGANALVIATKLEIEKGPGRKITGGQRAHRRPLGVRHWCGTDH